MSGALGVPGRDLHSPPRAGLDRARSGSQSRAAPPREAVQPVAGRVDMDDDLSDQPEGDGLHTENQEQHAEEQQRAVGDSTAGQPLDEEDEEDPRPDEREQAADQAEEPKRSLGEPNQEVEPEKVERPPEIDTRSVHPGTDVSRMLGAVQLPYLIPIPSREHGKKRVESPVEGHLPQAPPPNAPTPCRGVGGGGAGPPRHDRME